MTMSTRNIEAVSSFLAESTDKSTMIFRRFDTLAVANIIHLHDQLTKLETTYPDPQSLDADTRTKFHFDLHETITKYHKALFVYRTVLKLDKPADRTVRAVQDHLPSIDVHDYSLGVWDTKIEHKLIPYPDLVALFTSSDDDIWSRGLARYFPLPFLDYKQSDESKKYINEKKLQRFVTLVGAVIAIGFLITPMWALWAIGDGGGNADKLKDVVVKRLCIITAFVTVFALWLAFGTCLPRKEVITGTAAYAAVLVVYVGKA